MNHHLIASTLNLNTRDLGELMSGGADWRNAARRLQVRYLLWGLREAAKWPASMQPWKSCARLVARTEHAGALYDISSCLLGED